MRIPGQGSGKAIRPTLAFILIWLGIIVMMVLSSKHITEHRFPDVDDALRLVQVRDLMAGQGWFDLHQYRMNPPDGTLMHWSRLVDLPLAGLIWLLALFLPIETAEYATAFAMPLLLLLLTMLVMGRMALEKLGLMSAVLACATFALVPLVAPQFQPFRIDHHAAQVLTIAVALWGIARRNPRHGAIVAGIAMAAGLMVSLETIFMAAGFALVLTWRWLVDPAQRMGLTRYLQSLGGGLVLVFLLTRGLADLAQHRDAISPAHLAFFLIMAAGTTGLAALPRLSRPMVLAGLAACGIVGLGVAGWWAPQILQPPFAGLDPLVHDFWYLNVAEGRPLWLRPFADALSVAFQCLFALGITVHLALRGEQGARAWWGEYAVLLGIAFASGLMTYRSMAFAGMMATIPFGWFAASMIARWQNSPRLPAKLLAAAALYLVLMPHPMLLLLQSRIAPAYAAQNLDQPESTCEMHRNTRLLNRLPAGTIFAPLDISPLLLLDTHHSVVASGHHRSELAMRDVIEAFTSDPSVARARIMAHKADYVVACMDVAEVLLYEEAGGSEAFASLLAAKQPPVWLEPVDLGVPDSLRVWRVLADRPTQATSQRR
jgi:hypothetical protein